MMFWMRSRALPVYFAIYFTALAIAVPVIDAAVTLAMHDRMSWPSVSEGIKLPLALSGVATFGEARRRRSERTAR